MPYHFLKQLHVTCVVLSGLGFTLRGVWMLADSPLLQRRWAKVTPHLVDTLLLGSAIGMATLSAQYPFVQDWLTAKFFGLLAYILCGTVALKRGRSRRLRRGFLIVALAVYSWIVSVALTRQPWGWLGWLF